MSSVKLNQDLFLGTQELNRLVRFLSQDGHGRNLNNTIESFGIVSRNEQDINFGALRISAGSGVDSLSMRAGYAIDKNLNMIANPKAQTDIITIPTDGVDRYLFIKYKAVNTEEGTVNIFANGDIAGTGTFFTEILRGQPNFPTRIKFPNSALNTGEYDVVGVTSDTVAVISGALVPENNQEYIVVGTFTPDHIVPSASKDIFQYDSFELVLSTSQTPSLPQEEFLLAKVNSDGVTLTFEDQRNEYFDTKGSYNPVTDTTTSVLAGVELEKWAPEESAEAENIVRLGWGFRVSAGNWSGDIQLRQITINAGSGGIFDTVTDFTTGDFNGYNLYVGKSGKPIKIVSSFLVGSTIQLNLRQFSTADIPVASIGTVDLVITPRGTAIEIVAGDNLTTEVNRKKTYLHDIRKGYADLLIKYGTEAIKFQYRIINGEHKGLLTDILDGDYINANSFDKDGNQTSTWLTTTVSSTMVLLQSPFRHARIDEQNYFTDTQTWRLNQTIISPLSGVLTLPLTGGNVFMVDNSTGATINSIEWGTGLNSNENEGTPIVLLILSPMVVNNSDSILFSHFETTQSYRVNDSLLMVQNGLNLSSKPRFKVVAETNPRGITSPDFSINERTGQDKLTIKVIDTTGGVVGTLQMSGITASRIWRLDDQSSVVAGWTHDSANLANWSAVSLASIGNQFRDDSLNWHTVTPTGVVKYAILNNRTIYLSWDLHMDTSTSNPTANVTAIKFATLPAAVTPNSGATGIDVVGIVGVGNGGTIDVNWPVIIQKGTTLLEAKSNAWTGAIGKGTNTWFAGSLIYEK